MKISFWGRRTFLSCGLIITMTYSGDVKAAIRNLSPANDAGVLDGTPAGSTERSLKFLKALIHQNKDLRAALIEGRSPEGPRFMSGVLDLMIESDTVILLQSMRAPLFDMLEHSTENKSGVWDQGLSDSEQTELRTKFRTLRNKFPMANASMKRVVAVYNTLELWDVDDVEFIARRLSSDIESEILPLLLYQLLPKAAPKVKDEAIALLRKNRSVSGLGVAYLLGLLQPTETESVLRIRLLRETGFLGGKRDIEIYKAVDRKFAELLTTRDPAFIELFEKYRERPSWPGKRFDGIQASEIQNYLRKLWTLQDFGGLSTNAALQDNVLSLRKRGCELNLR